jgi:hypothetical protein
MLNEEKFLELAKAKYSQINDLEQSPTMLDYERGLRELMNELTPTIMEEQLGGQTTNRRKKKVSLPPSAK